MSHMKQVASAAAVAGLILCSTAAATVQRTFVASFGNDANTASNCSFINPCRGFAAAQGVTTDGGEIVALDAAGYGAITIDRSISIIANPGFYAGIASSTGDAVTIATASVKVRLSGLKINGIGGGAANGIVMTNGTSLTVENCIVSGFNTDGIHVNTAASVRISDTTVANNGLDGIVVDGGAKGDVVNSRVFGNGRVGVLADANSSLGGSMAVTNTVSSANQYGFGARTVVASGVAHLSVSNSSADHNSQGFIALVLAGTSATVNVSSSKVTRNTIGLVQSGAGAVINSAGNNFVIDNGGNSSGTITNVGTM